MSIILLVILVAIGSCLARAAGGGLGAHLLNKRDAIDDATEEDKGGIMPVNLTMLPEILFGLLLSVPSWAAGQPVVACLFAAGWAYAWMETGHGIAFHMGRNPDQDPNRKQTLSKVVDWIAPKLGLKPFSRAWCWLFMGIKGFLIGLPLGPYALLLAVLWPAAYDTGQTMEANGHVKSGTLWAEHLSGAAAGILVFLTLTNLP